MTIQTLYQIVKTLHIFGFIITIGITAANLIAYHQFWKLYIWDRAQGTLIFPVIQKLQVAGMIGMITVLLAGISMLAIMHWSFTALLWFQIKLALIVLIFLNGLTAGRTSALRLQALLKQEHPAPEATVKSVQQRTRLFFIIQLILFSTIVVLSVFRFTTPDQEKNEVSNESKMNNMKNNEELIDEVTITHQYATLNGIRYHYAEAVPTMPTRNATAGKQGEGPLVIMIHGFPELWYSWRHQLAALAKAGYHVVAPDLRGFGESEVSPNVRDYSLLQHARDVKALIDHLGAREATVIGHDWGANVMWIMPMLYPETVKAVVALSIPFYPEPRDPSKIKSFGSGKFNQYREPGLTEAEFNEDPARFFRLFFFGLSGDAPTGTIDTLFMGKFPADAKLLDGFPEPPRLPAWLTQQDLDYYVAAYKKTGITGALGFYRNMVDDYPSLKELYQKKINQPVLFIGGGEEPAVKYGSQDAMKGALPNLRRTLVLPGCGHWLQQERTEEVNAAILEFLNAEVKK